MLFSNNITKLDLKTLSHIELHELISNSREAYTAHQKVYKSALLSPTRLAELDTLLLDFDAQVHKVYKSATVEELDQVDSLRDDEVSIIAGYFKLHAKVKTPDKQAAYKQLAPLFKGFGSRVTKASYEKESELIKHLVKELNKEVNSNAVNTLGLRPYLVSLQNAQTAFDRVYKTRLNETKSLVVGKSKELRLKLIERYTYLIYQVAANAYGYPEQTHWVELLEQLNAIRKRYKKHKKAEKEAEKAEDSPQEN